MGRRKTSNAAENIRRKNEFIRDIDDYIKDKNKQFGIKLLDFRDHVLETGKNIEEFTSEDFQKYFDKIKMLSTMDSTKSIVKSFISDAYPEKLRELSGIETKCDYSFFANIDELYRHIQERRQRLYKADEKLYQYADRLIGEFDKYSSAEISAYLVWLGIPENLVTEISFSDFYPFSECFRADGKEFYYTGFPDYLKSLLLSYADAEYFLTLSHGNRDSVCIKKMTYVPDTYIKHTPGKNVKDGSTGYAQTLKRYCAEMEINYKKIFLSGCFSRGYAKYVSGQQPDWTDPKAVESYFGVYSEYFGKLNLRKREWSSYLKWIQGKKP